MSEQVATQVSGPEMVRQYLEAFEARNQERCLTFYSEEARIDFQGTVFQGREAIRTWHEDRFAADLKIDKVEAVRPSGSNVVVDVVVSSSRLAAWKIKSLPGRITLRLQNGKIRDAKFAARMTNVFDLLRSGSE